jgi:hypothetical protein
VSGAKAARHPGIFSSPSMQFSGCMPGKPTGRSIRFPMKSKSLLRLGAYLFAVLCLSSAPVLAAPPEKTPLGANEARITGHKATLLNAVNVVMTLAEKQPAADWKNELILPAGPARLAIGYRSVMPGGAIGGAAEFHYTVEIAFEAEAGHEYHAVQWGKSIFNMGYKITDKTTGKIVGQAKVKDQKKAGKESSKAGN